jgi:hypothetical protein
VKGIPKGISEWNSFRNSRNLGTQTIWLAIASILLILYYCVLKNRRYASMRDVYYSIRFNSNDHEAWS